MPDYPSNISRAQFALIQPDLENFRKHTRPRRYDLYDVFNAILYSLTTGCQWRELPHDFPEWHTVYRYYDMWRDKPDPTADSLLERLLKKPVASYRFAQGRSARTSFVIVDAQSVKTTDLTKNSGYDGGKKISGIKRHLAVDINGFPQAIHITRANITDRDGAIALVTLNLEQFKLVRTMMVDSGYTGQNFANEISSLTSAKVIVVKRNELHQFSVIPQRWLIERSFSWLGNYHRLWRNCERKLNTSLMMVSLAFIRLLLKRY
ncbi:IS5 family transposase [Lacticaseibacillus paracasei]|uniref:IS5 family transposase n=1 Tax=Lacticaseibacillus paracasei TaxID=1597 RepID=UPI000C791DC0|nr:IS5 family transposase [Lacticaseibacillus paracasei]MBF4174689.1 IS5 family transposase [Lacticaseibacillus paracasei subsp. tolerans]QPC21626.1 IS5 family transposase [Lacticaseibacillus paracasei subsp. tolerans]UWP76311.1 IS5 family transposase [Lacticaseibacillus paracasei]